MTAAQKAFRRSSDGRKHCSALRLPNRNPGLTPLDQRTVYDFEGYAYIHLNNYKMAQQRYEAALATDAYSPESG